MKQSIISLDYVIKASIHKSTQTTPITTVFHTTSNVWSSKDSQNRNTNLRPIQSGLQPGKGISKNVTTPNGKDRIRL